MKMFVAILISSFVYQMAFAQVEISNFPDLDDDTIDKLVELNDFTDYYDANRKVYILKGEYEILFIYSDVEEKKSYQSALALPFVIVASTEEESKNVRSFLFSPNIKNILYKILKSTERHNTPQDIEKLNEIYISIIEESFGNVFKGVEGYVTSENVVTHKVLDEYLKLLGDE